MQQRYVSFLMTMLVVAALGTTLAATHQGGKSLNDLNGAIALIALVVAIVTLVLEGARFPAVILVIGSGLTAGYGWDRLPSVQRNAIDWFPRTAYTIITTEVKAFVFLAVVAALFFIVRDLLRENGRLAHAWRSDSNPLHASS